MTGFIRVDLGACRSLEGVGMETGTFSTCQVTALCLCPAPASPLPTAADLIPLKKDLCVPVPSQGERFSGIVHRMKS